MPFSLHPPPAALESQTPQREPRALPRRAPPFHAAGAKWLPQIFTRWEPRTALRLPTVRRTRILSVTAFNPCSPCRLPFNKERSSVIYRDKGGTAACVWRNAKHKMFSRQSRANILSKIQARGAKWVPQISPQWEPLRFLHKNAAAFLCKKHRRILRFGELRAIFTNCLKNHHRDFTTFGYYILTLHFHIFLLFPISFLEEKQPDGFRRAVFFRCRKATLCRRRHKTASKRH